MCGRLVGRLPFGKIVQMMVSIGVIKPIVADKMMVSNGVIGAICSWQMAGFTRRCLLTCDKAVTWDWQHVGLSVATVTTVRPC